MFSLTFPLQFAIYQLSLYSFAGHESKGERHTELTPELLGKLFPVVRGDFPL